MLFSVFRVYFYYILNTGQLIDKIKLNIFFFVPQKKKEEIYEAKKISSKKKILQRSFESLLKNLTNWLVNLKNLSMFKGLSIFL